MTHNLKTAAFIDGCNFYAATQTLGLDIDFTHLLQFLRGTDILVRACYYTPIHESSDGHASLRPLADWLQYNGYSVVTKPTKTFQNEGHGTKIKGNMDVELTIDALLMADHVEHIVLFSGDGDFTALVAAIQRKGVRVTVISTIKGDKNVTADELRRQADAFVDLHDIADLITGDRKKVAA